MSQSRPSPALVDMIRAEKVPKRLARAILREIAEKNLQEGAMLPSEQVMAQQYGVGRGSVREALRLLEAQGLIVIRPGLRGGPVVGRPTGAGLGQTLTMFFELSGTRLTELLEAASVLDGEECALAAERATKADIRRLRESIEDEHRPGSTDMRFVESSVGFHAVLRQIIGNGVLDLFGGSIGSLLWDRVVSKITYPESARQRVIQEHVALVDLLDARDVDAARALGRQHMNHMVAAVLERYPGLAEEIIDWR